MSNAPGLPLPAGRSGALIRADFFQRFLAFAALIVMVAGLPRMLPRVHCTVPKLTRVAPFRPTLLGLLMISVAVAALVSALVTTKSFRSLVPEEWAVFTRSEA